MAEIYVGARASVECNFRVAGVLADPLAVSAIVRSPSGNVTTYSFPADLSKDATGVYRCEFTVTEAGSWGVRFEGSGGPVEAVGEELVSVLSSNVI